MCIRDRVKACGFCGHEMIQAKYAATEWTPFGHEFSGIVEKIGENVQNVSVGDTCLLYTSKFISTVSVSTFTIRSRQKHWDWERYIRM